MISDITLSLHPNLHIRSSTVGFKSHIQLQKWAVLLFCLSGCFTVAPIGTRRATASVLFSMPSPHRDRVLLVARLVDF